MTWLRNHERARASLLLGLSFALSLLIGVIVWTSVVAMRQEIHRLQEEDDTVTVIVAAHTLGQGHPIGADDVSLLEVPEDYVAGATIRDRNRVFGRVPHETILAGEMIREERLAPVEKGSSLAALVPRGMRVLTVNLAGGAAVSGFLEPGNWVDVLVTMRSAGAELPSETVTLLQTVRVMGVDERVGRGDNKRERRTRRPAVTLLVTPEDAERLTHAVAQGEVTLVLRNDVDVSLREEHGATSETLLGSPTGRLDVQQWRAIQEAQSDGSTLFIRGDEVRRE